jgi:predicted ATPase
MLIALGASLHAMKGAAAPETEQTYIRAHHLCQHRDDPHQLFPVLRGLWQYYHARTDFRTAHPLGEQLHALAQQVRDASMMCSAHRALGTTLFYMGAVADAHTHFVQGIAFYDPQQHRTSAFLYGEDAGVMCRTYGAWTLWYLGYPDQGLGRSQEAVTLAQQMAHPFSLAFALLLAAILHQLRREVRAAQEHAEVAINIATEQGFPFWMAMGSILRGWTLAQQGQAKEEIEQMRHIMAGRAAGAGIFRPYLLALLAEAYGTMEQPEAGLTTLTEALALADKTGERWYESEIHRLKGELLLQQSSDNQAEVENCFQQAITIAQNQQAKSFELRAATSLAKLWYNRASTRKRMTCSPLCITGLPRVLIRLISKMRRRYWMNWRMVGNGFL